MPTYLKMKHQEWKPRFRERLIPRLAETIHEYR